MKCFIVPMTFGVAAETEHDANLSAIDATLKVNDILGQDIGGNLELDQGLPTAEFPRDFNVESILEILDEDQLGELLDKIKDLLRKKGHDYL